MGSIRPLVTITILVVVGAYLYVKINEGPMQSHAGANANWNQSPDGVPPLTPKGASLASESGAPAWPTGPLSQAPPATTNTAAPAAVGSNPPIGSMSASQSAVGTTKDGLPAVPAIPELPELPTTNVIAAPPTQSAVPLPKDLPANIPSARYPDEPGQSAGTNGAKDILSSPPPLTTNTTDPSKTSPTNPTTPAPVTPPIVGSAGPPTQSPATNTAPPQTAPSNLAAPAAGLPSQSAAQNPLRPATPPTTPAAEPDRYAATSMPSVAPPAAPPISNQAIAPIPSETTFAASWPTIQTALDRGDLKQAHQLLSKWHGNESLTPAETERVETLLAQLAGTVIYSTEHQLEPPRVVKPGETLESIAKEYNVPSPLLAKINGIQPLGQLSPGQALKVVRGPFSAVVDLHRSEITLMIDDRYAGKFHVVVSPGSSVTDGQWVVDQKLSGPPSTANPNSYATMPNPAERTIILRNASTGALAAGGNTLLIAPASALTGPNPGPPALRVSSQDAEELSDILSVGSRITVRR